MKTMRMHRDELTIRKAVPADAEILCDWWNDGRIMAHAGFPNGLGTTVDAIAKDLETDDYHNSRLILEVDDIPVGEMNYRTKESGKGRQTAEIGIKICIPDYRNRGIGTRFLRMLITYIFETMNYDRIILDTNLKNPRAQHVYQKLGFRETGRRIDSWTNQIGEPQSSIDYELLKEDYTGA